MIASPATPKKPAPVQSQDMDVVELMKAMGGNGWFNPESNDQIKWQILDFGEETVPRAIYRMHAWMKLHTTTRGNRQPYANRAGTELHLDHMAEDLDIELHNLRAYWRRGEEMGLWRKGTKKGERPKGLYLNANIAPVAEISEEEPEKGVCTNPLPEALLKLKPYMREQLERLSPETLQQVATRFVRIELIRNAALAEVVSAVRTVIDQDEDTLWREFNIEKKRLDPTKKEQSAEELAEAAERQHRLDALIPHVQGYVQTLQVSVQTQKVEVYEPPADSAQTPEKNGLRLVENGKSNQNGRVSGNGETPDTLLVLKPLKEEQDLREGGLLHGAHQSTSQTPANDGKKSVHLPARQKLNDHDEQRAISLLSGIAVLQRTHPEHFENGEVVDLENKGDWAWAAKAIRIVPEKEQSDFVSYIRNRVTHPALGKRVGLGLILEWAGDFRRGAPEREKAKRKAAAEKEKREAFERAAAEARDREAAADLAMDLKWSEMPELDREQRIAAEAVAIKADPTFRNFTAAQKRDVAVTKARSRVRNEMEAAGGRP
jgi:hypothetical protein